MEEKGKERSEEQIITRMPLKVSFGGVEYPIKVLPIRESAIWREKFAGKVTEVIALMDGEGGTDDFINAFRKTFFDTPELIIEMVFSYAPDLPKETILETGTDAEMMEALMGVVNLAYPFGKGLLGMIGMIASRRAPTA